ncbi:hypothetical protein Y032_0037g3516 [Ancylostoma ceylanicum]|uniref:Uncharacterized protein n=1 Tax=Ancylostoma ceylanicum TaxID=53326 RepID=A0A016ULN0_9BILA|nr:hypothetical protein Y032_0037g3516 [Ancylostoma ceylanicum]
MADKENKDPGERCDAANNCKVRGSHNGRRVDSRTLRTRPKAADSCKLAYRWVVSPSHSPILMRLRWENRHDDSASVVDFKSCSYFRYKV